MAPETQKLTAKLNRNIPILFAVEFLLELQFFFPVAILVFQGLTGSYAIAMNIIALGWIAAALFEVPTGMLSDRLGRKMTLISSNFALIAAVGCYALPGYAGLPVYWLFVGSVLHGLCFSLWSGADLALLYESLAIDNRADRLPVLLGRLRAMTQIGLTTAGVAAGGLLLLEFSYQDLIELTLIPCFAGLIFAFFIVEPRRDVATDQPRGRAGEAVRLILENPKIRWLALATVIENGIGRASFALAPGFIALVWPTWLVPFYRSGQNALGAVGFWISGLVVRRTGPYKTQLAGSSLSVLLSAVAYIFATVFSPILMMLSQLSWTFTWTANNSLQQENFSDTERATMGSAISLLTAIVGAAASFVVGLLADFAGPQLALIFVLIASLPAAVIYYFLFRRYR